MKFISVFIFLFLTGCAKTQYKIDPIPQAMPMKFPSVHYVETDDHIFRTADVDSMYFCTETPNSERLVLRALKKSNVFKQIELNNQDAKYRLEASIERCANENGIWYTSKAFIQSLPWAAINIFPIPFDYSYKAGFSLYYGDELIEVFEYVKDTSEVELLRLDSSGEKEDMLASMAMDLIFDINKESYFDTITNN